MKKFLVLCAMAVMPLFAETNVLVFAGSLREGSYNKKLAQEAARSAREMGARVTFIDLKDFPMPFYDADLEASIGLPKNAKRLRDLMIASDVVMIATPEYNHSIPAVLKNTLDWASRSETGGGSRQAFKGKKFGIMSAAAGGSGGAGALDHLRAILEDCGGTVVQAQVGVASTYETGALEKESVLAQLQIQLQQVLHIK